jgi:hypothetical protein
MARERSEDRTMPADRVESKKKSILEQMIAISSLIFAVVLISVIAIPQMLQALFRLIYCQRKEDIGGKLAIVRLKKVKFQLWADDVKR